MTPDDKKDIPLEPLEITSPRTAEQPGPGLKRAEVTHEDSCCSAHPPKRKPAPAAGAGHAGHAHAGAAEDHEHEGGNSYLPALISLALLLSGIALDFVGAAWFSGYLRPAWFGIAYGLVGWKVLRHAVTNVARGSVFNEFFLMSIATLGAFYLGQYAEGVAVMLFYVIGEHFQEAAVARSRKSIKALIDNRPDQVGLLSNGQVVPTDAKRVRIGEVMQVKAGEKVALDAELLSDHASLNTAALTGESKPDRKGKGEKVLAGMINLDRVIHLQVTSLYEDSALSRIGRLVEEAAGRKAKTQQFITRFAKVYTPIVVFLALGLALLPYFFVGHYVFADWLYRALVFLVISCPCALVISIPLGYFGGIGAASRNGILFKGSNYLDLMRKVNAVVMDKTGTLTEGAFKVRQVVPVGLPPGELVALAAALESQSTHPVARAVTQYAGQGHSPLPVGEVEEIPGHGLRGRVAGKVVLTGNGKLMRKFNVPYDPVIDRIAETTVLVAVDGSFAGYLTVADQLKPDALPAVQALRQLGISDLVMLSGDQESVVRGVAASLGIDQAFGGLLPEDKVTKVEALKARGRTVAFVGDGLNDAPVIALADVGVAMGGLGSDAAIETADVVIQTDQPAKIATAIRIGRQTHRIVWQNIGLAFGVKALVLAFGAFGVASLWEAVFADVGVAFLAILNAVRIQRMTF